MIALVGKLPAHGDFLRRGGPLAVVRALDDWLDGELAAAAARDGQADRDPGAWRFGVVIGDTPVLGTMIGSHDAVGRSFPLVGVLAGCAPADFADADRWCGAAIDVLRGAQADGIKADAVMAALTAIVPPTGAGAPSGWWRAGEAAADGAAALPTGADFARLLERAAA